MRSHLCGQKENETVRFLFHQSEISQKPRLTRFCRSDVVFSPPVTRSFSAPSCRSIPNPMMNSDNFLLSFQAHCHFPAIPKVAYTMLYSQLTSQHLRSIDHTALSLVNDGAVTLLVHKYSMHRAYRATIQLWLRWGLGCVGGRRQVRLTEWNSCDVSRRAENPALLLVQPLVRKFGLLMFVLPTRPLKGFQFLEERCARRMHQGIALYIHLDLYLARCAARTRAKAGSGVVFDWYSMVDSTVA